METYFVISNSDGDTRVRQLTKSELLSELEDGLEYSSVIKDHDPNYWGYESIIIKGEIITPRPVEKIVTYEL